MATRHICCGFVIILAANVPPWFRGSATGSQQPDPVESGDNSVAKLPRQLQGTTSCSASVCHGGANLGQPFSEATTWRALDPHACAYDALLSSASVDIAKRMWSGKTQAHEAPLCLKCHVHPGYEQARPNFAKKEGVGCESCHGAAENWLAPHYRHDTWSVLTSAEKQGIGLADTKSLAGRATVCVSCHVGTADAAVDHDLIAAGHPALRFEFATYFANLPAHWDVNKDKRANSTQGIDFEARAWAIGQLVNATGALDLLAHRATPTSGAPWPELAELNCFSCHHDLQAKSRRQDARHLDKRRPGSLVWSDWYYAMLPNLLRDEQTAALRRFDLRKEHGVLLTKDDRAMLAKDAKDLANSLKATAAAPRHSLVFGTLVQSLNDVQALDQTWENATQHYFALLVLQQMNNDKKQPDRPELERLIERWRGAVTFPRDYDGPKEPLAE